jgi:fatty-acid peroxygenase
MPHIPRDKAFDNSLAFLREGYTFISSRCDQLGTDLFRSRIMLTPVVCMRGAAAAAMFYRSGRFTRVGAMPKTTLHLLQDQGSVQTLDGAAHRLRKQMFMQMMRPEEIERLTTLFAEEWRAATARWADQDRVVLHDAVGEVLTRAALRWIGIPLARQDVAARCREQTAMIENAGSFGLSHLRARLLRNRSERWAAGIVREVREGKLNLSDGTPLAGMVYHRETDGQPLSDNIAAIELLNLLRPTVAVARFITFSALALHRYSEWRGVFASGNTADLEPFVQEVRRFYPFFPAIGGRACESFNWSGYEFRKRQWVLLDIYGTNHHEEIWPEPEAFRPERFRGWTGDPNTLIPQGAGIYETGHRCPGEWITIALMKEAVRLLAQETGYDVPAQDLTYRMSRMPALPESGFVIANVRGAPAHLARKADRPSVSAARL